MYRSYPRHPAGLDAVEETKGLEFNQETRDPPTGRARGSKHIALHLPRASPARMGTERVGIRRLSADGCKTVGTQLSAEVDQLKLDKIKLHKEVHDAASDVISASENIKKLESSSNMPLVDRYTDSSVAAFDDTLEAIQNAYAGEDILSLSAEEQCEWELATKLRRALLPDGTGFVQWRYRLQWARLEELERNIEKHKGDLAKLGMANQTQRLLRWIQLYGAKLGVTQSLTPSDAEAKAVDRWHDAWENLETTVRYHYRRGQSKEADSLRDRLLSIYDAQANVEREDSRGKQKKKTTTP